MKIELELSEKNEGTSAPWWVIVDPRLNHSFDHRGVNNVASMITGPYFSRESAENYLKCNSYNFSEDARVFCMSGCYSPEYVAAINDAERQMEE